MAAWEKGRRHQTWWASDTALTGVGALLVLLTTAVVDVLNGPEPAPAYLTGACGLAAAWLFGAAGSDKQKREADVAATATRADDKAETAKRRARDVNETALSAESKIDQVVEVITEARPDLAARLPPPLIDRPSSKPGGDA